MTDNQQISKATEQGFACAAPLLTDREGCAILGIAKPTWHKWVQRGLLPRSVKLGHLSRWPRSEILAVIENAKAARSAA